MIPTKVIKKLERMADNAEWISEDEACQLLGMKKKSIQNKVSAKVIPADMYRTTVVGTRVYNRSKLLLID
jgi:hypothetical protein